MTYEAENLGYRQSDGSLTELQIEPDSGADRGGEMMKLCQCGGCHEKNRLTNRLGRFFVKEPVTFSGRLSCPDCRHPMHLGPPWICDNCGKRA